MSNDRHNPEITRKMATAAAREPIASDERDERRRQEHEREREQLADDRDRPHIDERGHLDAREMAGQRHVTDHDRDRDVGDDRPMAMFAGAEAAGYRTQWDAIQTGFVDEPRKAVQEADALVTLVMKRLSEVFTNERSSLERQWGEGDEISTEDLRVALRRYRSFFERLLTL
jgi:hypothetical protein